MPRFFTRAFIALLAFSLLFPGCKTSQVNDGDSLCVPSGAQANFSQKHFLHAYLAYAAAGQGKDLLFHHWNEPGKWEEYARGRIQNVLDDYSINYYFGNHDVVWGPAVSVDRIGEISYTPENMMYCLKQVVDGKNHYYVGIAGTNFISPYDWFAEDLDVSGSGVPWRPTGGVISQGSYTGFQDINALKDPKSGQTLQEFLAGEIGGKANTEISVAGHSLGGALTQVYSSYLRDAFKAERGTTISAWVYAGPTAGDADFATGLTTQLGASNYHAYNNSLDMIPHAWDEQKLNKLCTLYDNIQFCGSPLGENVVLNGVVGYFKKISAGIDFKVPGNPTSFTGNVTMPTSCIDLDGAIYSAMADGTVRKRLEKIYQNCTGDELPDYGILKNFFYHLDAMGKEHTLAYFNNFFGDLECVPGVISRHITTPDQSIMDAWEALDIMEPFLKMVEEGNLSDCSCVTE